MFTTNTQTTYAWTTPAQLWLELTTAQKRWAHLQFKSKIKTEGNCFLEENSEMLLLDHDNRVESFFFGSDDLLAIRVLKNPILVTDEATLSAGLTKKHICLAIVSHTMTITNPCTGLESTYVSKQWLTEKGYQLLMQSLFEATAKVI